MAEERDVADLPPAAAPVPSSHSTATLGRRFDVHARLVQAQVVMAGTQGNVNRLTLDGNVRLEETQTAQPDERPLLVTGDRVQTFDAAKPYASVLVTGNPARVAARGIALEGTNVNMNGGTNRLTINGSGRMDLVLEQEIRLINGPSSQRPSPQGNPQPVVVTWQQGMVCNGRTVRFERSVQAKSSEQTMRTDTLDIDFKRPIRFTEMGGQTKPEIERLRCQGGVWVESRSFDPKTQGLTSIDRLDAKDLTVNRLTGEVHGNGPGQATSIRRGNAEFPGLDSANLFSARKSPSPEVGAKDQLNYLEIRFLGDLAGNLKEQRMSFRERVRSIYGPVPAWDASLDLDRIGTWSPQSVVMSCNILSVTQMPTAAGDGKNILLNATESAQLQGDTFKVLGDRMSFEEAKGLVIVQGDGWTKAQMIRQEQEGAQTTKTLADQIWYWPKQKRIEIKGQQSLEQPLPMASKR